MMDFSLKRDGRGWASEDPQRLGDRVAMQVEVIVQQAVQGLRLREALLSAATIGADAQAALGRQPEIAALGLEVLGVSIIAIKPTPDIARALEAESREANLESADEAIYRRRMTAVQNERAIRENELETDVAVVAKQRQIRESEMETRVSLMRRENALRDEQLEADTTQEQRRAALVDHQARNARELAEAEAHRVGAVMRALADADPRIVQALAAAGMQPGQLIAQAFGGIAERADRIGQLNMSPELLQSLLTAAPPAAREGGGRERAR